MPVRRPDLEIHAHLLEEIRVRADKLVRLSRFPVTEPYWSRGRYRFDGPPCGQAGSFGTCYATSDIAVAFCESVIHECAWFRNGHYEIARADLTSRHVVQLHRPAAPELALADLSGKALKALGLNNDISAGNDYTATMAWALAIHDADARWDGIRYVSRQHNDGYAVALFERSGVSKARMRKLTGKQLNQLCDAFRVVAV